MAGRVVFVRKLSGVLYLFVGAVLLAAMPQKAQAQRQLTARVQQDGLWYFITPKGDLLLEQGFQRAENFREGFAAVVPAGQRNFGFINRKGEFICDADYESVGPFSNGLAPVAIGGRWGMLDTRGKLAILPHFQDIFYFEEGLASVRNLDKWGAINTSGTTVVFYEYENHFRFRKGMAAVQRGEHYGFIDREGHTVLPFRYKFARNFNEGYAAVELDPALDSTHSLPHQMPEGCGFWTFIDRNGDFLLTPQYQATGDFKNGLALVKAQGKWGFVNIHGTSVVKPIYQSALPFAGMYAPVQAVGGKWGFVDRYGRISAKIMFDGIGYHLAGTDYFTSGLQPVLIDGVWGYINTRGQFVIQPIYEEAMEFSHGLAAVKKNGLWGYIRPDGREAIPFRYTEVSHFHLIKGK